jgi:GT2 family glycosyltransferase
MREQWSARRFPTWKNAVFGRRSLLSKWFPNARVVREYLFKDELERGLPFIVDWIPGSCTLVRREAAEAIGGLPESLHYWSDAVFCDRLRRVFGGNIYVVPDVTLIHFEGQGSGKKSLELRNWLVRDFHRGAYAFYCEHYQLGPFHPARWLAAGGLGARAQLLMWINSLKHRIHFRV